MMNKTIYTNFVVSWHCYLTWSIPEEFLKFLTNNNFEVKVVRDYFDKPKQIDNVLKYVEKHRAAVFFVHVIDDIFQNQTYNF